ncbi:MAG: carbonic anhydrase [Deltaproteobacteria bacterium]|nr:carbonic anhydrase [Deltaproteobacteria bacterium]
MFTKSLGAAALITLLSLLLASPPPALAQKALIEPTPQQALAMLKAGNARFLAGEPLREHQDAARIQLADISNQAEYAYATILSCSDSRVPLEHIFDAGIMDLFVVRVAGNVAQTDEVGTIEYGLAHVKTPLLVVLGHTRCGAVAAVAAAAQGNRLTLERNIPPLVEPIFPAVQAAMKAHPQVKGAQIVPYAIEQNVWQAISDLFLMSPATREMVTAKKVMVVGAIYDLAHGKVRWLPQDQVAKLLQAAEKNPKRAMKPTVTIN